jgi:hypothetical protein
MSRKWTVTVAAALGLSCATAPMTGGPESPVRLDTEAAVGWEPEGPFTLDLVIYNASGRRIELAQPRKEAVQVKVFRSSDGKLVCKTPAPTRQGAEGWDVKGIRNASGLKVSVDVWPYCQNLTEGVYRYEAVYAANGATSGTPFTGLLGPQGGQIVLRAGISRDEAALAAALADAAAHPAAPTAGAAEPSAANGEAAKGEQPSAPQPASPPPSQAAAQPAPSPDSVRACVDKELAARGLNAYGDPQGTRYEDKPPVEEGGRILYVASRVAAIRAACRIPGF